MSGVHAAPQVIANQRKKTCSARASEVQRTSLSIIAVAQTSEKIREKAANQQRGCSESWPDEAAGPADTSDAIVWEQREARHM